MSRFVEIPAERLLPMLRDAGAKLVAKGGSYREGVVGREVVADFVPPHGRCMLRLYTSLSTGARIARGSGDDAVRIVVCVETPEGVRMLAPTKTIHRTAPTRAPDRVGAFLARLLVALRGGYRRAARVPACLACGRPMAVRESSGGGFLGCSGYPRCRETASLPATEEAAELREAES